MGQPRLKYNLGVYIAAARVRVNADRRLGIETPETIRRLARGEVDDRTREAVKRAGERRERAERTSRTSAELKMRRKLDVYVAAAELRVAVDKRLGIDTPESIRRLARGEIDPAVKRTLVGDGSEEEEEEEDQRAGAPPGIGAGARRRMPRGVKPRVRWIGARDRRRG